MKYLRNLTFILFLLVFSNVAQSETLKVSVDGLDNIAPDNIWTYQINFDIIGPSSGISIAFNDISQHLWKVIPGVVEIVNWEHVGMVNGNQFVILADNKGDKMKSPLLDGLLFEITYGPSTNLNLAFFSFVSEDLINVAVPIFPVFDSASNSLTFSTSTVPIPSSLILLGGGVFALLGITRRKK